LGGIGDLPIFHFPKVPGQQKFFLHNKGDGRIFARVILDDAKKIQQLRSQGIFRGAGFPLQTKVSQGLGEDLHLGHPE